MMEICSLGTLNPNSSQRRIVFDSEYISPTLTAAAGEGGGQIPMVLELDSICNFEITSLVTTS